MSEAGIWFLAAVENLSALENFVQEYNIVHSERQIKLNFNICSTLNNETKSPLVHSRVV